MAITEVYVDPSIAGNSGTGTIGDPYGDLQYALDTQTRDATNGDKFNIKSGTDEILAAQLDVSTYGTPTEAAPLMFRGYTAAADDGGIGGISGNGSVAVFLSASLDFISFIDLHLHNTGANDIIQLDNDCNIINCELDGGQDAISIDLRGVIARCYIHNCSGFGINTSGVAYANYMANGASDFSIAMEMSLNGMALANIIDIDSVTDGINVNGDGVFVSGNSIFSSAGTGQGIVISAADSNATVINNIIEGFSGVGGIGISVSSTGAIMLYGFNAFYNNTTNLSNAGDIYVDFSANDQSLGSSPFTDAANQDFTVTTAVKALAYPTANYNGLSVRTYLDIGALQREEAAAGGGLLTHPSMTGGIRG